MIKKIQLIINHDFKITNTPGRSKETTSQCSDDRLGGWENRELWKVQSEILHQCRYETNDMRYESMRVKQQVELGVICLAVIWKNMQADEWPQQSQFMAKNRSPGTNPWGTPVENWRGTKSWLYHDTWLNTQLDQTQYPADCGLTSLVSSPKS